MATVTPSDLAPTNPQHLRAVLHEMQTDAARQSENLAQPGATRITAAERAAAIGWALKAEVGQVNQADPVHGQTLDDWIATLEAAAASPTVAYHLPHARTVALRTEALHLARRALDGHTRTGATA